MHTLATEGETTPLVDGRPIETIRADESLYSYVLFVPAVSHARTGKHCSLETQLGVFFFLLNLVLQVGLTWVVGNHVLEESTEWQGRLVNTTDFFGNAHPEGGPDGDLVGAAAGIFSGGLNSAESNVAKAVELAQRWAAAPKRKFRRREWDPLGSHAARHHKEWEVVALGAKPGGGGGKGSRSVRQVQHGQTVEIENEVPLCLALPNGTFTCSPPSLRFVNFWTMLDADGDGQWTEEEAQSDSAHLHNELGVRPGQVWRAAAHGLTMAWGEKLHLTWADVVANGISRPLFDWWAGDIMMCQFADVNMCTELAARGLFDGILDPSSPAAGKGLRDLNSAVDYCTEMLRDNGKCDKILPQTFTMYRKAREEQCGAVALSPGPLYEDPYNERDRLYTVQVNFSNVGKYYLASDRTYQVFLVLILMIWFISLIDELRELLKLTEFLWVFPDASKIAHEIEINVDCKTVIVEGITSMHRGLMAGVLVIRVLLLFYLCIVGTVFLINETDYLELLLNAVALAFIITIDEMLYAALARTKTKADLDNTEALTFPSSFPDKGFAGWVHRKDFWGLVVIPLLSVGIVALNYMHVTRPVLSALECACNQRGEHCLEAVSRNHGWWDDYWAIRMPQLSTALRVSA